jgi:hypothetical protein
MAAGAGSAGEVFGWFVPRLSFSHLFPSLTIFLAPQVLQYDRRRRSPHLVVDLLHLPPFLRRRQGSGCRPRRSPLPCSLPAVPYLLRHRYDFARPLLLQVRRLRQRSLGHCRLCHLRMSPSLFHLVSTILTVPLTVPPHHPLPRCLRTVLHPQEVDQEAPSLQVRPLLACPALLNAN